MLCLRILPAMEYGEEDVDDDIDTTQEHDDLYYFDKLDCHDLTSLTFF